MEATVVKEDFGCGNYRYWLDDRRIAVIFGAGNMTPAGTDAWSRAVIDTANHFPGAGTLFMLLELNQTNQGFTDYTRSKILQIYEQTPHERDIYLAVLLRNTLTNLIITSFINYSQMNALKPNLHPQIFTSRDKALAWLRRLCQQGNN